MKKPAMLLALAVLLLAACDLTAPPCNDSGVPVLPGGSYTSELDKLFALTNEARAHERRCGNVCYHSTGSLTRNSSLDSSADKHAKDMAHTHTLSHDTPAGAIYYPANTKPEDRMRAEGYVGHWYGENIARGQANAAEVITDWLESPGHCANIMNPNFKDIGLGHATDDDGTDYWVQDFGAP